MINRILSTMQEFKSASQARESNSGACSKTQFSVCGIKVSVYGLKEAANLEHLSCLWLLHPRLQDQDYMEPTAWSTIKAWYQNCDVFVHERRPGLIAAAFDQRNHGSRIIDPRSNDDWRSGNDTHAVDMSGIIHGTVSDLSLLMSYIPSYLFPNTPQQIGQHLVCGVSLGGHAVWQALFNEPRVLAGVSVIGSPDLQELLNDRARLSKREELHSRDFPVSLLTTLEQQDPASKIFSGLRKPNEDGTLMADLKTSDKITLRHRLQESIGGKEILNLSGAEDKLVPYRCSAPFIKFLLQNDTESDGACKCDFRLKDKQFAGVGHHFSAEMGQEVEQFVVRNIASFWRTHFKEASKM